MQALLELNRNLDSAQADAVMRGLQDIGVRVHTFEAHGCGADSGNDCEAALYICCLASAPDQCPPPGNARLREIAAAQRSTLLELAHHIPDPTKDLWRGTELAVELAAHLLHKPPPQPTVVRLDLPKLTWPRRLCIANAKHAEAAIESCVATLAVESLDTAADVGWLASWTERLASALTPTSASSMRCSCCQPADRTFLRHTTQLST